MRTFAWEMTVLEVPSGRSKKTPMLFLSETETFTRLYFSAIVSGHELRVSATKKWTKTWVGFDYFPDKFIDKSWKISQHGLPSTPPGGEIGCIPEENHH